jgi:opacity protein-like surface antigen
MKGRGPMRWLICAAFTCALAPSALAADLDTLRGSEYTVGPAQFTRWAGFYAGGQVGFSSSNVDFSKATQPLLATSLQQLALLSIAHPDQWTVLSNSTNATAVGFGGFVGYNTQWQDLILGVEANYTHASFTATATNTTVSRVFNLGSAIDLATVSGSGSLSITDYGSLRARAGYILGNFLPYGFAVVAIGHGSYAVTADASGQQNTDLNNPAMPCIVNGTTCADFDHPSSNGKTSAFLYGFSVGGGMEWAITPNIFVRGEYEFIQFAPVANITAKINTGRVGAGFKF